MHRFVCLALCVLPIVLVGCSGTTTTATQSNNPTAKPRADDFLITNISVRATRITTASDDMGPTAEPMNAVSGAYLRIENRSAQGDQLLSATTDAAGRAEIHQTIVENDIARMQHMMEGVTIPANGVVEFKPGGYHIMLRDLKRALEPGQTVQLTLRFRLRGEITISAPVTRP